MVPAAALGNACLMAFVTSSLTISDNASSGFVESRMSAPASTRHSIGLAPALATMSSQSLRGTPPERGTSWLRGSYSRQFRFATVDRRSLAWRSAARAEGSASFSCDWRSEDNICRLFAARC